MHFGTGTTWRMGDKKEQFRFIYHWSANQINYYQLTTFWELEDGKTFIKWILIGKAKYVCGEWFLSSIISGSR